MFAPNRFALPFDKLFACNYIPPYFYDAETKRSSSVSDLKTIMQLTRNRARRTFLKARRYRSPGQHADADFGTAQQSAPPQRGPLVIRGGTVLTMDPAIGDFASADILVEGSRIVDVKPSIGASAEVVDARGMVVIPGLVDAHRHCWQAVFRRAIANADFGAYSDFANALIPAIRPEDVHVAHLLSDLGALHAGITCLLDYSHVTKRPRLRTPPSAVTSIRGSGPFMRMLRRGSPCRRRFQEMSSASSGCSSRDPTSSSHYGLEPRSTLRPSRSRARSASASIAMAFTG